MRRLPATDLQAAKVSRPQYRKVWTAEAFANGQVYAMVALIPLALLVAEWPAAPTFQELMAPGMFPDAQCGMVVESVERTPRGVRVVTTGATMTIDAEDGIVALAQRIGHQRPVAELHLGSGLAGLEVTHEGPGFARVVCESPALTIRINGDSLLMLHCHEPLATSVVRRIPILWSASHQNNHVFADEWGAFGVYCSQAEPETPAYPHDDVVAQYPLSADEVLWVGVCPPKPYDWERSLSEQVIWHWSNQSAYPPDDVLESWAEHGDVVLLQSEVLLWKDWNLGFEPRLGPEEFSRVRETLHRLGMRFIVYTSPYYFLRGTALEPAALNSFENFAGWPPGTGTGENMGLFLPEIRRVMEQHKPDGLYFDGQYIDSPAALYALAREARAIVGEQGILEWHSTFALGPGTCSLPQADAYVDYILRGEGRTALYEGDDYLRYFVSGYNIHNSIGVLCNNDAAGYPTADLTERLLALNGRYHTLAGWLADEDLMTHLSEQYFPRLTPELRGLVDEGCDRRQARAEARVAERQAEFAMLRAMPPEMDAPDAPRMELPADATTYLSEAGDEPATMELDGASLRIRAHGHSYAYASVPLEGEVQGFIVAIHQGTDEGMSWGPGAMVQSEGGSIRLGARSDGLVQTDVLGSQVIGPTVPEGEWVWLRARWGREYGVVEMSSDGQSWTLIREFAHAGSLVGAAQALLIGKVPHHGQPVDHSDLGAVGECRIGYARVFQAP